MAKNKKKKHKLAVPNKKLLIFSVVVLVAAIGYGTVWFAHNHAVTQDRTRFARAGNDVETVANAVVAAVGQPADRKDGGKCSYFHQENNTGPITCEVYSYLAYGVGSPDEVNNIVTKVEPLQALHSTPLEFKITTEKPHQFNNGVTYTDNFVALRDLFDSETKTNTYHDMKINEDCALNFNYHNSVTQVVNYPNFDVNSNQIAIVYLRCAAVAKAPYFSIE